jgi:hypothetical protein
VGGGATGGLQVGLGRMGVWEAGSVSARRSLVSKMGGRLMGCRGCGLGGG